MRNSYFPLIVSLMLFAGNSYAVEYVYVPETEAYGEDASITYSNRKISELAISPLSSKVAFSGEEPMEFADGGYIKMPMADGHELIISNKVVANDGFLVKPGERALVSWAGQKLPSVESVNRTIVVEKANISDYEIVSSDFSQSSISGTGYPYFISRGDNWMEAQIQVISKDSSLIKCVKIRLEQQESNIVASKVYARYALKTDGKERDFENITEKITSGTPTESQYRENSYDITQLTLRHIDPRPVVTIAGAQSPSGSTTVGTFQDDPPVNEWRVFAVNQTLATMKPAAAKLAGASLSKTPVAAHLRGYSNDGANASVWVQYMASGNPPGIIKGLRASFRQNGNNVEMKVDSPRYLKQPAASPYYGIDTDLSVTYTAGGGIAPTVESEGYCLAEFTAVFPAAAAANIVTLSPALSAFGGGVIGAAGNVALAITNSSFGNGRVGISLSDGARLLVRKYDALLAIPEVKCDSGSIEVCFGSTYLRKFSLNNGSSVRGMPFRAGNTSSVTLYEGGKGAVSVVEPAVVLVGMPSGNTDVVLDVFDGDSTPKADVMFNGGFCDFESAVSRGSITIVKKGSGTASFSGAMTYGIVSPSTTVISNGIWELSADDITLAHQNYVLAGGEIAAAAATTNKLGTLKLDSSSSIALAAGSVLDFADSSQVEWAQGVKLDVACDSGHKQLRFGNNASSLTLDQLGKIRINGKRVVLDENGWVKIRDGLKVLVR